MPKKQTKQWRSKVDIQEDQIKDRMASKLKESQLSKKDDLFTVNVNKDGLAQKR